MQKTIRSACLRIGTICSTAKRFVFMAHLALQLASRQKTHLDFFPVFLKQITPALLACSNQHDYAGLSMNESEQIVNIKFAALATTFFLTTGCALNGPTIPPEPPNDSSPVASNASQGSSSTGTQQASAGSPTGRTRAEVHAEALEAVKHYKSTQSEERDYFNPYAR